MLANFLRSNIFLPYAHKSKTIGESAESPVLRAQQPSLGRLRRRGKGDGWYNGTGGIRNPLEDGKDEQQELDESSRKRWYWIG